MASDSLLDAVKRLFALLEDRKVDFVLVGGIALLSYIEGRNTEDLDLIITVEDLQRLPEIEIVSQDENFSRGTLDGLQIDFLLTKNALFANIQKEHTAPKSFLDREIQVATVEGLVLLKLFALPSLYRQGSFSRVAIYEADIAALIQKFEPNTPRLLEILAAHLSDSDLREVDTILAEIQERIARFKDRSSAE